MRDLLKSSSFTLPNGDALAIRELSAGGRRALVEATKEHKGDPFMVAAVAVKAGCPEFKESALPDILDAFPADVLNDVSVAVLRLSGLIADAEAQAEKN
jgi:hypothetical protein